MTQAERVSLTFETLSRYAELPFAARMAKVDAALMPLAGKITRAMGRTNNRQRPDEPAKENE